MRRWTCLAALTFALLSSFACTAYASPQPGVFPGLKFPAGERPTAVAVGDVDRDGLPDVVTANYLSADVSVLLAGPDGRLSSPVSYPVGERPTESCSAMCVRSIVLGDLDRNGLLDVVTANPESGDVSVLWALPEGGFLDFEKHPVIGEPSSVALGDVDGDGLLDIVTACDGGAGGLSVLLARAEGGVSAPQEYPLSEGAQALALGDIDGDGLLDVVVSSRAEGWEGPGKVIPLLGRTGGGFEMQEAYDVGESPSSVALGDLDRDGRLDIVAASAWGVYVLNQLPQGGFAEARDYPGGTSVALGDLNGDGHLDIATAGHYSGEVSVLIGDSAGGFVEWGRYPVGNQACWGASSVALADLNGDGLLDIVTPNGGADDVSVLFALPGAQFVAQDRYRVGSHPFAMAIGDLDLDGRIDVATANIHGGDVSVLVGLEGGGFAEEQRLDVLERPWAISITDLNRDAYPDLVTLGDGRMSLFYGRGDGTFQGPETLTGLWLEPLRIGDLDADGFVDIVTRGREAGDVWILRGRPEGGFAEPEPHATGAAGGLSCLALGDVDGDGRTDLVTGHSSEVEGERGWISILLSQGEGGFAEPKLYPVGDSPRDVALGDVNGDGRLDVVAANARSDDVSVLVALPGGGFAPEARYAAGTGPASLALGDVNRDGLLDMVTANHHSSDISLLVALAEGGFATQERYAAGDLPNSIALADVDGDGLLDALTANYGYADRMHDVSVLYNLGARIQFIRGDANADGSVDISDAVRILSHLFLGEGEIPCLDGADLNDNGELEGDGPTDAISLLGFLFLGGPAPAAPSGDCGIDPTADSLSCLLYEPCEEAGGLEGLSSGSPR